MTYILQKQPASLRIRVGKKAKQLILQEGFSAQQVDTIPGAAGGPKGLGLQGLDQAIFGQFLPAAPQQRTLVGASIGSWRFASILALGAKQGTERLADLYTHLTFHKKMTRFDIGKVCHDMLHDLIGNQQQQLVNHPDYHLAILAVKAQHLFQSDRGFALAASLSGIIASNTVARRHGRLFMQRVISQPHSDTPFRIQDDGFITHYQTLTPENVMSWLMASASIPVVMPAIRNIPDAPVGSYRDGGLIDYHIDLPFNSQGIVLYPHFTDHITPGWFDKMLKWRKTNAIHHAQTLLISPSASYLQSLPLGRLPDRKDFGLKGMTDADRVRLWKQCIAESQRMGDEFLELVEKQNLAEVMVDL
ncbi:MAG: patatin-like phospholipase family protein [Acinetobacter sp.]